MSKLLLVSFIGHCLLLFLLFFVYRGAYLVYHIHVNKKLLDPHVPIIFLPFQKVVQSNAIDSLRGKQEYKDTYASKFEKKEVSLAKKAIVPKTQLKKSDNLLKKSEPTSKTEVKKHVPQHSKIPAAKQQSNKQQPNKQKTGKQQTAVKKPVENLARKEEKADNVTKKELKEEKMQRDMSTETLQKEDMRSDNQNALYVGRDDLEALYMYEYIQEEIIQHWKPPLGVSKDLVCQVKILVGWEGKIEDITMAQSSGVLIYDISARSAVLAMGLPKWAWGKEFMITFKQ